jgi:hypothetical protein
VGAVAATLPFYKLLETSALGYPNSGPPLRFVAINDWHGRPLEFWRPQPGFGISYLNCCLQPFDDAVNYPAAAGGSLKSKLVVLDGVSNLAAIECNSTGHGASPAMWTGSTLDSNSNPSCASFETFLSTQGTLAGTTAFPTAGYRTWMYSPTGRPLAVYGYPGQAFTALFGSFAPPGQQATQAQLDAIARGKSSMDFITGTLTSLQSRLAAAEKTKLDEHLTAIRQIENRLQNPPSVMCTVPPNPDPTGRIIDSRTDDGDWINPIMSQIFLQAIACDLTRFIQWSIQNTSSPLGSDAQDPGVTPSIPPMDPATGQACADGLGATSDCVHQDVAHKYVTSSPFTIGGGSGGNGQSDITSQIRLARAKKYGYQFIAQFASQLDAMGLLDSTLVMTGDDVGNPALHDSSGLPCILVGGANGAIKMGQHLMLNNVSQNAVFVAIANAFGVPITSYGVSKNPSTMAGPLPGLLT